MSTQGERLKAIADAIRAKDGSTAVIPAKDFPARIGAIQTGTDTADATAVASDILAGKTAYGTSGKLIGIMPNRGAVTQTLSTTGAEFVVPKGYHDGTGKVTASITNLTAANVKSGITVGGVPGAFTGDATATASDIANEKTAYVNGSKIVGSVNVVGSGAGFNDDGTMFLFNNSGVAYVEPCFKFPSPTLFRSSYFNGKIPLSEFGDAAPEDVAVGKTFTSAAGLKIVGAKASGGSTSIQSMSLDVSNNCLTISGEYQNLAGRFFYAPSYQSPAGWLYATLMFVDKGAIGICISQDGGEMGVNVYCENGQTKIQPVAGLWSSWMTSVSDIGLRGWN